MSCTPKELGCHALKEFAAFNAESALVQGPISELPWSASQEDIYMRGGIQAVLRAMEHFPQLPGLQVRAVGRAGGNPSLVSSSSS
eukprot:Skav211958  [mRNA]  locus=scaffold1559:177984:179224:- [translate_table: standard]